MEFKKTLACLHIGARLKAFLTDLFLIYTPILYFTTYVILGSAQAFRENQLAILSCVCVYGVINALFISKSGQTPGLRYTGLMVLDQQGQPMGLGRACVRFVLWLVVASTLIGFFTPFFSKDKRFLHDVLCQTQVKRVLES
ncbi:RDD family protein [Helicobacter mehlei]|uniref:RDD family protein n=1 Tax=Helicobacter mehlei TaxID=2316080 RepID=A0A553V3L5_9HELI|nr:RDD family protein [Helicobacter mehlei]TSA87047.1 RDD family protein [Helicobacter mehlei]